MFTLNGIVWKIVLVSPNHPALYRDDGSLTIGMCDSNTKIIYINAFLDKDKFWDVLVHEITHAALYSYGLNLDKTCHEELIADFVAMHGSEIIDISRIIFNRFF